MLMTTHATDTFASTVLSHPHCRVSSVLETPPATATMNDETRISQWNFMSCLVESRFSSRKAASASASSSWNTGGGKWGGRVCACGVCVRLGYIVFRVGGSRVCVGVSTSRGTDQEERPGACAEKLTSQGAVCPAL
jgi:hypothetical protein